MTNKENMLLKTAPILMFVVVIIIWHYSVKILQVPAYLVPSPSMVLNRLYTNAATLFDSTVVTGLAAGYGFLLSLVIGIFIAFIFSQSVIARRSFYPYAIFLQTVPIVAIAPLIIVWFGNGFYSVVLVAFIISLFPIITNGTTGLINIKKELLELFMVNNASSWQILFKLRFPHSIQHFVTGAKISSGLSVIGAIVGEFFVGYGVDEQGLGYIIMMSTGRLESDYLFAVVLMCTLLGLLFFSSVSFIGNHILKKFD